MIGRFVEYEFEITHNIMKVIVPKCNDSTLQDKLAEDAAKVALVEHFDDYTTCNGYREEVA